MNVDRPLDFLVIGAQKAGTTAFARYLSSHDQIWVPRSKEVPFFSNDALFAKGHSWYRMMLTDGATSDQLVGTVSPQYLASGPAPSRIAGSGYRPSLLAIIRDPVTRAISHYRMEARRNRAPTLDETRVDAELLSPFVDGSRYAHHLGRWLATLPRTRILLLAAGDLRHAPEAVARSVADFLDIDASRGDTGLLGATSNRGSDVAAIPVWLRSAQPVKAAVRAAVGERRYHELLLRAETGGFPGLSALAPTRAAPAVPAWARSSLAHALADETRRLQDFVAANRSRIVDGRQA